MCDEVEQVASKAADHHVAKDSAAQVHVHVAVMDSFHLSNIVHLSKDIEHKHLVELLCN